MKIKLRLIPKGKKTWVGKKYDDAFLVGFGRDGSLILLTKIKGKPRGKTTGGWSPTFWKVPDSK